MPKDCLEEFDEIMRKFGFDPGAGRTELEIQESIGSETTDYDPDGYIIAVICAAIVLSVTQGILRGSLKLGGNLTEYLRRRESVMLPNLRDRFGLDITFNAEEQLLNFRLTAKPGENDNV